MIEAAEDANADYRLINLNAGAHLGPEGIYAAMLSSAPQQPSGGWRPDPGEVAKIIDGYAFDVTHTGLPWEKRRAEALLKADAILALPPPPVGEGSSISQSGSALHGAPSGSEPSGPKNP